MKLIKDYWLWYRFLGYAFFGLGIACFKEAPITMGFFLGAGAMMLATGDRDHRR